jgi:ACS family tartrate transporter-like MFS transporter
LVCESRDGQGSGHHKPQFGLAAGILFIGYALFEIPSNLILHKIGARIWLARILIIWGLVSALTGLVQNMHQLYLARFLLGTAEAGYFPGIILYLTYWFRRPEQAQVLALLLIGIPITSIVGALFQAHPRPHSLAGPQQLALALYPRGNSGRDRWGTHLLLASKSSAEASFLADDEKNWITQELERESEEKRKALSVSAAGALVKRPRLASRKHRLRPGHRVVHSSRLSTSDCEEIIEWIFQYHNRTSRDGA